MRLGLEAGNDTLDLAVELGIGGVPIVGPDLINNGVDATLAPLRERGLAPCHIGMFGYNPLAESEDNARLPGVIALAAETGCRYIAIGPGNHHASGLGHYDPRNFKDVAIRTYAESLKPLLELAEIHDAVLTIEAYLKGVVRGHESFQALAALVGSDRLRCNLDPSSLYGGLHDFLDPMPLVNATIDGIAGRLGLVHIKEVGALEGFHLHMGLVPADQGHTDWAALLKRAKPFVPDNGWVIVEHCQSPDEARATVALIRAAAERAELRL